jgi:hypothetical protein
MSATGVARSNEIPIVYVGTSDCIG